jgi:hypothetical protein
MLGTTIVDLGVAVALLATLFFCIRQNLERVWGYNETVHQLFVELKEPRDSVRREVVYRILVEFEARTKQIRITRMRLNETYREVGIGKQFCLIPFP